MARLFVAVALFGVVAFAAAEKEWTGKTWLGSWASTDRAENWEAFVDALGLPSDQYPREVQRTIHTIYKQGDKYHHEVSIPSKNFKKAIEYTLGTETDVQHGPHTIKLKYTEDGEKLVADVQIPSKNKQIHDIYEVQGDTLTKTYKVGDVVAKRWFTREANPTA
ncbi:hypothetical protein BV898_16259 [Hypsibius exemplaris]|uniref:Secretory-abundant heat soluble protein 53582 n=1 Tax=Hypsibius exemplaris TaxID=2072580 RepID=SAHS2_HYPEX|nr:RecName: Full=Secretory-abundant heat soluble protein 53582; Short=SAHS 53582; AltName: Full=Secretory-abundant heat soluble protein b; Short=SAHS-b; AltName: Full=Tardigrade-specific intrinsically disordered protein SAHS 53582; Short=TDP SAHS 53582; Flags: Precursor [Hypsibius exemplaris]OWA51793.1 hypothetical protein BV898_16259 [Hypsibius exemplaris]